MNDIDGIDYCDVCRYFAGAFGCADGACRRPSAPGPATLSFTEFNLVNRARCSDPTDKGGFDDPVNGMGWGPVEWAAAIGEEAGEVLGAALGVEGLKGSKSKLTDQDLADEIADVVIYCDLLATRIGRTLSGCITEKFNRVSEKRGSLRRLPAVSRGMVTPAGQPALALPLKFHPSGALKCSVAPCPCISPQRCVDAGACCAGDVPVAEVPLDEESAEVVLWRAAKLHAKGCRADAKDCALCAALIASSSMPPSKADIAEATRRAAAMFPAAPAVAPAETPPPEYRGPYRDPVDCRWSAAGYEVGGDLTKSCEHCAARVGTRCRDTCGGLQDWQAARAVTPTGEATKP